MTDSHIMRGINLIPLEHLLQWNDFKYGECLVRIDGIYYPKYAARHLVTGRYTYCDTQEQLFEVMDTTKHYQETGDMLNVHRKITERVKRILKPKE